MVPEFELSPDHRSAILDHLPLKDLSGSGSVFAEVAEFTEQMLGEQGRRPAPKEAFERLSQVAKVLSKAHLALSRLDITGAAPTYLASNETGAGEGQVRFLLEF